MNFFSMYISTGTPQAFPVTSPAISDQSCSTSNSEGSSTSNPKSDKEKERRDKTNQLFAELYDLVKKDTDGNLSQAKILKAGLQACIEHKRKFYIDIRSRGLHAGLKKVDQLANQYLESLNLQNDACAQLLQKLFEEFRDVLIPVFTPNTTPANPPAPSTSGAPANENADEARKEKKKDREQGRRDNLGEGFDALKKFINENKLFSRGTQKIHILEAIVWYLKSKPVSQPSPEMDVGFRQGRYLGQNLAVLFFRSEAHLSAHCVNLHNYFISQLGSIDSSLHIDKSQFDINAILNFMARYPAIFNLIIPLPAKFWRPWE